MSLIDIFIDHWVIVRKDGTRVLNGREEEFKKSLQRLIEELKKEEE